MILPRLQAALSECNWTNHLAQLNANGYTILPNILIHDECKSLIKDFDRPELFRSAVNMKAFNFGQGLYKYYQYPLPSIVQTLRYSIYDYLVAVANQWMIKLNLNISYSQGYDSLHTACVKAGQVRPTPLLLKYEKGDYNNLHQDLYGELYFPFQAAIMLSEPDVDYTGGAFVLLEQKPRMQSKAIVIQPKMGDIIIFTTNFRPEAGKRNYYKVKMKHGVSEVLKGRRYSLGIIFHDASQ